MIKLILVFLSLLPLNSHALKWRADTELFCLNPGKLIVVRVFVKIKSKDIKGFGISKFKGSEIWYQDEPKNTVTSTGTYALLPKDTPLISGSLYEFYISMHGALDRKVFRYHENADSCSIEIVR